MSLFDVIKYPINNPPTVEELEALPKDLIIDFLMKTGWDATLSDSDRLTSLTKHLSKMINRLSNGEFSEDIPILRQMIKDYDESV